jgi:hypothetical protein
MAIHVDEWLKELEAFSKRSDEGHTAEEISENTGMTLRVVRERLKQVARLGRLRVGRRSSMTIDGRHTVVPVYLVTGSK